VVTFQARLVASRKPGEATLVAGAPVDFFAVDQATGNRTYIGTNATAAGTGIGTLSWLVNLAPGEYGVAAEYTGNATHAPSVAEVRSCLNISRSATVLEFAGLVQAPVLSPGTNVTIPVSLHAIKDGRRIPVLGAAVALSIVDASGVAFGVGTAVTGKAGVARFTFDPEAILGGSAASRVVMLLASYGGSGSDLEAVIEVSAIVAPSTIRVQAAPVTVERGSPCTIVARIERNDGKPVSMEPVALSIEGMGHSVLLQNMTTADGLVAFDVAGAAWLDAGIYALTFTVLGNATIVGSSSASIAGGLTILPATTLLGLVMPATLPAHESIPVRVRASDGAGNPVIARVRVAITSIGSGITCSLLGGWTNATGEWSGLSAVMPAGRYAITASVDGDGNRLTASAAATIEMTTIQSDLVALLPDGDWFYPGDAARITIRGAANASWAQYVPVDVAVNGSTGIQMVLLEPANPSATIAWRIPAAWPTGDAVIEARVNETLSPYRGSASCTLRVRSRTAISMAALQSNGTPIGSMLYTDEAIQVQARLREDDGDVVEGSIALANGTLLASNLNVSISCSAHAAAIRAVNVTGDVPSGMWFTTCMVDPNSSAEGQTIRVSYTGDAYHDAAEMVLRFTLRKRPASLNITSVVRGSDGLHAAQRPAWLFHRSDTITVYGTLGDVVNASRGVPQVGIEGASVVILLDGFAVATCTTAAGGEFVASFVPASFHNATAGDIPDICQAGHHELGASFAGDATFLPNATARDEAVQVVEYMHVDFSARATDFSWTASEILFTLTIRDEDFTITTDSWLLVRIVQLQSWPERPLEGDKEVFAQYLTSGSYKFPLQKGGDFRVTVDRTSSWLDSVDASGNSTAVYWSELRYDVDTLTEENASDACVPCDDFLLVNPPNAVDCSATLDVIVVNLAITWLPKVFVLYAYGLLIAAKSYGVRLALRFMVFIISWLLLDNAYPTDLWTGLIAMAISAALMYAVKRAIQQCSALLSRLRGGTGSGAGSGAIGGGSSGGSPGRDAGGGGSGGGLSDGNLANSAKSASPATGAISQAMSLTGQLVSMAWSVAGISAGSFMGGSAVSCAAFDMSMPGAQSSTSVKEEFAGMLSILRMVELGLLAIGALIITWQVLQETERPGEVFEAFLIRCLRSGVNAAFFTMTFICKILAKLPSSEAVGSVLIMFVLGVVVGMLIGTAIVEVLIFLFRIDLENMDFWARTFVQIILELVRWSVTLLVTYAFIASPGAVGSALLISILKELIVSMLKAVLFEMLFWALEAAINEGLNTLKIIPKQDDKNAQKNDPGIVQVRNGDDVRRDYVAKYWKTIGHGVPVYYIMHGKSHLWEWISYVLSNYAILDFFSERSDHPYNIASIKNELIALVTRPGSSSANPETYATLCMMLHLMFDGFTIAWVRLPTLRRLFGWAMVTNIGPDLVAYKNVGGVEQYAIGESKQPEMTSTGMNWRTTLYASRSAANMWQCSREWLRNSLGRDYLDSFKTYYPKAYEICSAIRDYANPAPYDIYVVIGHKGVSYSVTDGNGFDSFQDHLNNNGRLVITLYELQNPDNPSPSSANNDYGHASKFDVFQKPENQHLWALLDKM
jgi:hypothetical protein